MKHSNPERLLEGSKERRKEGDRQAEVTILMTMSHSGRNKTVQPS